AGKENLEGNLVIVVVRALDGFECFIIFIMGSSGVLSIWCALVVILIMGHYTLRTRLQLCLLF
ncbi:MAG: hypothetical protein RPR40_03270, partial [Bermanella sp.]